MGNSYELKLRQKDIGWISVQCFCRWYLLAESSFPLLWSGSHGKGPSVGLWNSAEEFIYLLGTLLHFFSSNSNWNSADTGTCEAMREADSYPSLHKLSSKMQTTALITHHHPSKIEPPLLGYSVLLWMMHCRHVSSSEQVFMKWVTANRFKHLVPILSPFKTPAYLNSTSL